MDGSFIDYGKLIDQAMRSIVKEALFIVKKEGLQGDHHFYITFYTDFPGVEISDDLKKEYEEEMTIVLQHQFWDLEIDEEEFSVTLSFNHKKQRLIIPFEAITAFADPSVKFGLQFRQMEEEPGEAKRAALPSNSEEPEEEPITDGSNIIDLANFRNNNTKQ